MTEPRWSNYVLRRGEQFPAFWAEMLGAEERNLLFVIGRGFDPRMCIGVEKILKAGGSGRRDCIALIFDEGTSSASHLYDARVASNWTYLETLIAGRGILSTRQVQMVSEENRRVAAAGASRLFRSLDEFTDYTDVVVDISAMPRAVYLSLLTKLLSMIDADRGGERKIPNLHVIVAENQNLDDRIRDEGIEDNATYLRGFSSIDREATKGLPTMWIPVLGEGKAVQMKKIREFVNPTEVCLLLPFPSASPRRGDDLISEYRQFLFDDLRIEPRNVIYADEQNPFQTYRQIRQTIIHYNRALAILGGCRAIVSALSSKLLSLGVLLSAYELKREKLLVGIAYVESTGYEIEETLNEQTTNGESELFEVWLTGECYEE